GTLETNGVSNLLGPANKLIDNRTINNNGTWTATGGGTVQSVNGATFNNLTGAGVDLQIDFNWNGDGTSSFNNLSGSSFKKTTTSGTTSIGPKFINDGGMVSTFLGTLAFYDFLQKSGAIHLLGGNISMICGMPLLADGGSCDGDGTI